MRGLPLVNERAAFASCSSIRQLGSTNSSPGGAFILGVLGRRNLVFSEAHQAVYELSDIAAHVWRLLDAGSSADAILRELLATGVDQEQARNAVEGTLEELQTLRTGSQPPALQFLSVTEERLTRLTIRIAEVAVQLHLSKELVGSVEAVFGPLIADSRDTDFLLCARTVGSTVNVYSPGQQEWSCDRAHFVPLLKAQIIESVLANAQYEVALHAAALVGGNDAVLLLGSPGAGKTTLAVALARSGFEVLADDVVLLDARGLVTGLSFPFTAKSSSWTLLSRHWPGIASYPSHDRPDGQRLCYIPLNPVSDPSPRRIGSVIILDRQDHARTSVEELDLACALSALVADGATRDQRLSSSGFTALIDGLRDARCCRLTYSDLKEGAEAVCGFHS